MIGQLEPGERTAVYCQSHHAKGDLVGAVGWIHYDGAQQRHELCLSCLRVAIRIAKAQGWLFRQGSL